MRSAAFGYRIERPNQDIENILFAWMKDNSTTAWSKGIRFVQFMKNRALHAGIKRSPYEAMFGTAPKIGLRSLPLPESVLHTLRTEEELIAAQTRVSSENAQVTPTEKVISSPIEDPEQLSNTEDYDMGTCTTCDAPSASIICDLCQNLKEIKRKREDSVQCLEKEAKHMRKRSDANFPDPEIGDTVRVQVPEVDRGKTDARCFLAGVLEKTADSYYRLGTRNGVLKSLYARSQFTLSHEKFLNIADVPTTTNISLRSVASDQALANGQGFVRCHCTQKCQSKRCLCVRKGLQCNSKCHGCNPCANE